MYGRIGRMVARAGHRDELIEILREGSADLPGCRSYVVARDAEDPDGLWITEVWEDRESHRASLELPAVRDAIARGRPLIASVGRQVETEPVLDTDPASPAP
jgi:quinol monooxygenase YgiN